MGQEGSGTRAVCLEAGVVGGTVGPFEVSLPNPNAPDYSYWTKTTRNYLTLGALFILLVCKAVVQGACWIKWT